MTTSLQRASHPVAITQPWMEGEWREHISLAGSETSATEPGYLAGALDAARRAASETTARLIPPGSRRP